MKTPCFIIIVSLVFFVLSTSDVVAQQNKFAFSVLHQARYPLKTDTNTILLINQFDLTKEYFTKREFKVFKGGVLAAIQIACNQLSTIPHTKVINLIDQSTLTANYYSAQILAAKYHPDYILALTYYHVDVDQDEDDEHSFNKELTIKFKLYIGEGDLYKELYGSSSTQVSRILKIAPSPAGNKKFIVEASQHAACEALYDYIPVKENISRPLYQDALLRPAIADMIAGRLDKAAGMLRPMLQNEDADIAAKAAYNLAVVYEIKGDKKGAIAMSQISLDKKANDYAADLISELKSEPKFSP